MSPTSSVRGSGATPRAAGWRLLSALCLLVPAVVGAAAAEANVWHSLGAALGAVGRETEAIASYRRSLELDPDNVNAARRIAAIGDRAD